MGSNCCKGEAGAQVYKGNGTEISIGPRLRKSPVYVEMMREETFQVDETPHFGAPFFLRKLNDYTVLVGTKAKLSVHISNTKDVKVAWFKDDLPAPETDRYVCSSNGQLHSLEIATVLPEDNAKWSCQGENAFGKCVCSGQLTVRVPETYKAPEFVDELRAILTSQGTISLECKVIGYPTPELRWFKDANEIKAGDMFGLTINGGDLASLGVYTCVAKNCVGTSSSSSKVRVQDMHDTTIKDKTIDKISPVFIEELERIKGKIGDRLELRCKINPSAVPQSVRWYNQSGLIEANEKYSMFEDGLGCFLVDINAAELCDAGEWKCVITCKDGLIGITTNVVELDVPRNYRAPRFMEGLKAVMTEEGLVSFECKVIGFPTPILRWYKDGRELKPGDVYHLTGVNSLGSYCCVARNSLGEASSTTFLSVNDIKAQLNEEEWMNLLQVNQAPIFKTGLVSRDVNIAESFRLSVIITSVSRPTVNWYKDDLVVEGSDNYKISSDESTNTYSIDVVVAQLDDQGEWKCVATNEFGQAGTSCFVKLIIPKHYRKPKFLENLKAVMLRDGTVNLECKVIGVPQPVLKWYKDGTELKPGDIHRIITGQDGKCCLGTYTCEAVNCMGSVSSTASLHGYDGIADEGPLPPEGAAALVKDASLSTIHEERTSQMFDTAASYESAASNGRGEISFTFDGKEVSVSLYETPELTNDEALQIVQMFADQLHQNINENENVTNMPALRFVKETSTSGQLVMEALVIDVPVVEDANLFEDDRRTDFDIDEMHDENTFTFESGIASSKVRTHRQSSNDQDEFRSMTSSEHSDLERDVMMSILSRDSLPVLTSPAKTADAATGDDTRQRLLSLVETVVFHLASIREEVRNQSDLAITASFMERSDKILADILYPAQQLHKSLVNTSTLESLLDPLELLARGLSVVEKCVQIGGYSRTFVYRTSVCIVEGCGNQILNCLTDLRILAAQQLDADFVTQQKIYMAILEIQTSIESAQENIQSQRILHQADSVAAMQDVTSIVTNRSIFEDIDFILKSEEPLGLLQVKNLQITVLEFEKSLATILTIVSQSENCNVRSEIARFGLTEVLLELKNKTEVLTVQCTEQRQQKIVAKEMKPAVGELNSLVEMVQANESYAEVISCLNDMFVPLEEMKTALSKLTNELRHVPESEYNSNQALEQQIEEFYELIVHLKEEIQRAGRDFCDSSDVFVRLEECLNRLFCIHTADSIDNEECARMEIVLIQLLMNHLTKIELSLQERTEQDMLSFMATAFLNVHDNLQHFSYMRANSKYEKIRQDILHHARKMVFFLIEKETSLTTLVERRKAIYEMALFSIHIDSKRIRGATEKYACEVFGDQKKYGSFVESLDRLSECATSSLKTQDQSVIAENEVLFDSLLRLAISMRATCEVMEDQTMVTTVDVNKIQHQYACLHAAAESFALYNTNDMARSSEILVEVLSDIVNVRVSEQTKDTQESEFAINTQCESLKTSIADLRDFIHETNSISNVQKPLTELETMVETLFGQPMQMESIEFVNAIASPIAKVTETLKNIDLQAAHVQPTVVLEDCLLEMCESLKQAQAEHTLEQAQENTSHSKLIETVTHVQHDIRECIQLEKDTREKTSQLQQGALESLKQSLSEVQQLVKADIVVKEVSKPLVALEATINELIGQPMQMESIEFVNAIASPIAKVTETLKNIDLQAAHVQPTVVLEDCLLEMCESLKQAQAEHTLEQAQENTSHSKLIETVTHVQHDIRECIQLKKNASTESPGENSSHGEDVVQIKVKIQTDSIPVKDQGSEMGSGPEMKLIEGVQRRAQDDSIQKIGEEATKNTEEEAKMKIADSSEKKVKKESKMKVQEEVKMDAEGVTNRKTEEAKKNAEEEAQEKIEKENKQKTEGEKAAEEAKMLAEEEAKKIVEEEAKKKKVEEEAEEKSQKKAEEAKKQAEEEAKKKSEEEAKKKAEESKKKAEEEAQKKTEEEAKKKADEAKKQAEEEAVKKAEAAKKEAEEEAKKRMEEEAKKMKNVEAEAQKKAEEEAKKKAEEAKKNAEEEAKKKAEVEAKKKIEEESRKKVDVEAQKKAEEETKKKAEEEAKKKAEEEALKKAEEEAKKKEEEEAHKKAEEETKKKAEEEVKKKKAEEEAKKKTEEEAKKRAEEAKKKAEEAKKKVEEEAQKKAEEEAKKKAEEAKKKREEETKKKAEEEAKKQAEEAKKKADETAQKKAEEEAKKKAEEEDKKKAEEEAKKKTEEEAQKKAEEETKKKVKEEAKKKKAEEEIKKKAEEEAKKKAEEAKKKVEEEAKKKTEEEAKKQAEEAKKRMMEEAKKKAEEEAKKKAEEEANKKAEEEDNKKAEEEANKTFEREAEKKAEEAQKKAEEEAQKKTEEEAKKKAEEAKKKAEEEAVKKAEAAKKEALEEAKKKVEEEAKKKKKAEEEGRKKAEEEAKKKAEEEAKKKDEEETKKQAEEEAKKKKVEEEAKKKKVEAEAKKKAEDEAKKKAEEAEKKAKEEAKKKLEEEAKKKAEEEAKKKAEKAKKNVEEEAKKKAVDEAKKIAEDAKKEGQKQSEEEAKKKVEKEAKKRAAEAEKDNLETNKKVQEEAKLKKKPETEIDTKHQEAEKKKAAMQEKEARNNIEKEKRMLTMQQNASMEKENHEPGEASNNEEELIQRRRMKKEIQKTEATTVVEESSTLSSMQIARRTPSGKTETDHKQFIQLSTLLLNFQELLSEIKRLFLTELPGKNLSGAIRNLKQSLLTAHETGLYQIDVTLVKLLLTPIENLNNTLESIDLYSCQSDCWSVLEECLLQVVEAFGQVQQKSEKLHSMTEWGSVFTVYKSILLILTDIRQCIYQRRTSKVETELTLNKTVVELQLLQKDLEYIKLLSNDRLDLSPKTVDSYFAQTFTTLTLLYPSVVAVVKKPAYSTCVNMLLSLTIPVHDLVKELPFPTSWNVESITPALKHNLRQLYRVVSAISQQQLTRVRNEREVSIVEELKRHLLSLDRVLKSFLDLYNKTEMQKELLETIRRNLSMLKTVMFQVRNQYSIEALTEKDDSLLSAFELVVEKLTINPLQLDSVEYLRLLAESLEKFCDIVRRLGSSVVISDWLLRYQLQLLKIFDTVEFCLSEEQFIVIGSKEKYTRTSTQDAIHTVKQLITHYKITSVSSDQDVRSERRAASSHIKVLAARQGLTEDRAERAPSSGDTAQRMAPDARQHRADTVRRRATRSPQGFRDEPPRSSSRCSLGALPSRRGPSFAVYLKNVFIERDHSFKLLCVVLDSEIDVRWTKDGVDIVQGGRYRVVQKNGLVTLQVDRADYEDTGVYACHVFNNYGQSFNKCTVEVYDTSDDIICPSFSIPQKLEYQQAITSQPISQYTEKPCPTNSTAGAHHYQRSSVLRASSSSSYDHTTVSEYSRRQPEQRESTVRRHVTAEQLRAPRATASRYSASSSYYTSQYGESSGLREATSAAESVRRQRRSYYHERLSAASSDYRGATTRREWTLVELRKSPSAPERVGSATERGEWREWSRKRTSPAVPGDAMDESGGSGKHTVSKTVQVSSSTTDSSSSRTETTTTLRVSEQGAFRKASPRLGTDQPSQTSSQSQSEHTVETDRLSASNRRSQTFPYHYRMDTFATPVRYESLASLEMYQPIVQTVLRDRMVKRGSNLILVCSFWGVNCEVEWVHNYARISNSAKYRVSFHQGMSILEIYDISRQEAGMYKCIVRNDCGEDVTNCCILVLDHIRLTSSTTGRTRPERHSLTRRY
uniref:Ig-like domain-containing protein n=1 Tax=Anopheles atroparvus TaxID=41427 RepID=A0AAG5CYZ5_ANOAO